MREDDIETDSDGPEPDESFSCLCDAVQSGAPHHPSKAKPLLDFMIPIAAIGCISMDMTLLLSLLTGKDNIIDLVDWGEN